MEKLNELKEMGVKVVILNGFKESLSYIMSLSNVKYNDGYNEYHCFETK